MVLKISKCKIEIHSSRFPVYEDFMKESSSNGSKDIKFIIKNHTKNRQRLNSLIDKY